jgi:hypothetical protein
METILVALRDRCDSIIVVKISEMIMAYQCKSRQLVAAFIIISL